MDAVTNPYTPNAGAEPQRVVGRDDQLHSFDLLLQRLARGKTEQSMIITGLRGVGKTVLLGQSAPRPSDPRGSSSSSRSASMTTPSSAEISPPVCAQATWRSI